MHLIINSVYFQPFTVFQSGDYVAFLAENNMLHRGNGFWSGDLSSVSRYAALGHPRFFTHWPCPIVCKVKKIK